MTSLALIADASAEIARTSARSAKTKRLALVIRTADPDDVPTVVAWLSGDLAQRRIGVGWAALATTPNAAAVTSLSVNEVNRTFAEMAEASGAGSQTLRTTRLTDVMARATETEQIFLRGLLAGNLRQGALAGVMLDAVAKAAELPAADVRRAAMLCGNLPAVADVAMRGGALADFHLEVGRALAPMLAKTASSVAVALTQLGGEAAFEAKLDGARIQIHKNGSDVRLFTRSLDDVTARLGGVVADVAQWPAEQLVADGEILWFAFHGGSEGQPGAEARPVPFQETASRFASHDAHEAPPSIYLFDLLRLDEADLIDRPNVERRAALESLVAKLGGATRLVDRIVTTDPAEAQSFFERQVKAGFEGVVAKSLIAPYEAGRRGASWRKIKPVLTLDLVVLAIEKGSGRRTGKLSNIHLGARDPRTGGFVMLGKTFKGMTDKMLEWQTQRFTELAVGSTAGYVVKVRPEQVVEIALDGVQTSSRYPGKMALRFARVVRYRDDKTAAEADTIDAVRAIHERTHGDDDGDDDDVSE